METNKLNEYLFADLVAEWAVNPRRARLYTEAKSSGGPNPATATATEGRARFTSEDLREGLRLLQECRRAVLSIQQESP